MQDVPDVTGTKDHRMCRIRQTSRIAAAVFSVSYHRKAKSLKPRHLFKAVKNCVTTRQTSQKITGQRHFLRIFYHKQTCLLARAVLCRPSIVQPCEAQRGEARRLAEQGFLHILYRKQTCLLARAFLRSPSMAQLREAQRGEARRLAKARLPAHILPQAKSLLARAFLRRPSIAQLREAQKGEARRLAKTRLPAHIIPHRPPRSKRIFSVKPPAAHPPYFPQKQKIHL